MELGKIYAYRKYPKDMQNPTDPNDEWCEKSPEMLVAFHMRQRDDNFRNGRPTKLHETNYNHTINRALDGAQNHSTWLTDGTHPYDSTIYFDTTKFPPDYETPIKI